MVRKVVSGLDAAAYKNAEESDRKQMCLAYISAMKPAERATYERQAQARLELKALQAEREKELQKALQADLAKLAK